MKLRHLVVLLVASLVACGDDGANQPDAMRQPDAPACTGVTAGTLDIYSVDAASQFISWRAPVTGTLGDGNPLTYELQFFGDVQGALSGTYDLHTGNQSNYKTCAICIRAFTTNALGEVQKKFFQSAGSIT